MPNHQLAISAFRPLLGSSRPASNTHQHGLQQLKVHHVIGWKTASKVHGLPTTAASRSAVIIDETIAYSESLKLTSNGKKI
uniref:Uncharacterized protein n=1 Tax=Oryza punctata TaxID=4537 RepID=A0A0E0KZE8_ORYPU